MLWMRETCCVLFAFCPHKFNAAYKWVLEKRVASVPILKELIKVTLSNQMVFEDILRGVLIGYLWRFYAIGIYNIAINLIGKVRAQPKK